MIYHEDFEINTVIEKCLEHFEKTGENPTMSDITVELGYELSIDDARIDEVLAGLASAGLTVESPDDDDLTRMLEPKDVQESTDPQRIYMKELGNYGLLSREQEIEYADVFNQSMREMLRTLATFPVVMERALEVLESLQPGTSMEQLYSDNLDASILDKAEFEARSRELVCELRTAWDAYSKRSPGRRTLKQGEKLRAVFSLLKFKPKFMAEFVALFDLRIRELKRVHRELQQRVIRAGVSKAVYATDFEPIVGNGKRWQAVVATQPADVQRELGRRANSIAEKRAKVAQIELELGYPTKELLAMKQHFELNRKTNDAALKNLVEGNLRLVMSNAQKYLYSGVPFMDLVQEGNLGLMRAAQKFEKERGFRFSTYATWWIKQAITRIVDENRRDVRLPANVTQQVKKVKRVQQELQSRLGREPKLSEVAAQLNLKTQVVRDALKHGQFERQIDAPIGDEEGSFTLGDKLVDPEFVSPEESLLREAKNQAIIDALMELPVREGKAVLMYYGIAPYRSMSQDAIANELGVSRERVRLICDQAMQRLRENETLRSLNLQ